MLKIRVAKVIDILEENEEYQEVLVQSEKNQSKAINYPPITGKVFKGDLVYLNTTAVSLGLGTGGYHFVMAKQNMTKNSTGSGHIMKMRYTPQQIKVLAVEEEASPYHEKIKAFTSLQHTPVLIGFLHSMVIPAIAGIRAVNKALKVSYIMTDGGALPLAFSKTVKFLKKENWLFGTITAGHAFGGDLEAINIYSALAAAFMVQKPDVILITMGPGNVGTGTELGTTAIEVGQIINAVHSLGGNPIVIPRISFQDGRSRHQGLSHHVLTCLNKIALAPCTIVIPIIENKERQKILEQQVLNHNLGAKHKLVYADGRTGLEYLLRHEYPVTTMGRSLKEDWEFFLAATAAGGYAAQLV